MIASATEGYDFINDGELYLYDIVELAMPYEGLPVGTPGIIAFIEGPGSMLVELLDADGEVIAAPYLPSACVRLIAETSPYRAAHTVKEPMAGLASV